MMYTIRRIAIVFLLCAVSTLPVQAFGLFDRMRSGASSAMNFVSQHRKMILSFTVAALAAGWTTYQIRDYLDAKAVRFEQEHAQRKAEIAAAHEAVETGNKQEMNHYDDLKTGQKTLNSELSARIATAEKSVNAHTTKENATARMLYMSHLAKAQQDREKRDAELRNYLGKRFDTIDSSAHNNHAAVMADLQLTKDAAGRIEGAQSKNQTELLEKLAEQDEVRSQVERLQTVLDRVAADTRAIKDETLNVASIQRGLRQAEIARADAQANLGQAQALGLTALANRLEQQVGLYDQYIAEYKGKLNKLAEPGVVKAQAAWRGHFARQQMEHNKRHDDAARVIQGAWRKRPAHRTLSV